MRQEVSAAELSRQSKITKQTISRKIRDGILIPCSHTESGRPLFDLEKSLKILNEQKIFNEDKSNHVGLAQSQRGGRPSLNTNSDISIGLAEEQTDIERLNKARADKAVYQAELAQIEVDEKRKRLVSVESVKHQGSELGSILINALSNLPERLSHEIASINDPHEVHKILTKEINFMVMDIRKQLLLD